MRWPGVHPGSSPLPPAGAREFSSLGAADGRNRDLSLFPQTTLHLRRLHSPLFVEQCGGVSIRPVM